MNILKSLLLIIWLNPLILHAQEDEQYVPFGALMGEVIDNVGQERLDAIERLFEAIDNNSTDVDLLSLPSVYFFKARELTFQGKYDEARAIANKIRQISPTIVSHLLPESISWSYSMGYVTEGFVSWIKKDTELAKAYFDSANTYFNDGFYANFFLGWIAQNEKEQQKALEYYTRAENGVTVIKYDWSDLYYKKGIIFHTMKLYNQAVESYTKSIDKFPRCKVYYERGKAYLYSSSYQDKSIAYEDFEAIIENCPDFKNLGRAYSYVGERHYYQKEYQKALEFYKKAYELQGAYLDAGNVSMTYYVMQDWDNTITWATKALNASQNDPYLNKRALGDYYFYRGYANWSLKRMDATVNDLMQARRYGHQTADQYLKEYFNK